MINVNDKIFDKIDQDEFWLLMHIAKRISKKNNDECWPSNKRLMRDTGWGMDKLQKVKKQLFEIGLLKVRPRLDEHGRNTGNFYKVNTGLIGIYVPLEDKELSDEVGGGKSGSTTENQIGVPQSNQVGEGGVNQVTEVLTKEVLTNELSVGKPTNKKTLEERKEEFRLSLVHFVEKYGKEAVRSFFNYWSELNRNKTKMRFEFQDTFEVSYRLSTWKKKDNAKFDGEQKVRTGSNAASKENIANIMKEPE